MPEELLHCDTSFTCRALRFNGLSNEAVQLWKGINLLGFSAPSTNELTHQTPLYIQPCQNCSDWRVHRALEKHTKWELRCKLLRQKLRGFE